MEARQGDKGQVMDDYLKCDECSEENHNGQFCRCESRNIRIAEEMRSKNISPWKPTLKHYCEREFKTEKIDECSGIGTNRCYGIDGMILEVWYADNDGTECYFDNTVDMFVNFCPFCGLKSQPERLNPEDHIDDKLEMVCDSLNTTNK